MKNDRDREMGPARDGRRERLQQKVDQLFTRIEGMIEALLDGVDMSELTSKERIMIAARFASLLQHTIEIDNSLEINQDEDRDNLAIAVIMQKMRGEKVKEKFRVIDAEITSYPENEDDSQDD
jgi:hypothetical protein